MILSLENLTFAYGKRVLFANLNATLAPGRIHYLAGPNGAGKSTLLKLLCGYLTAQSGQVKLDGSALQKLKSSFRARHLGVVWQNSAPALDFSVREAVEIAASARFPRWGVMSSSDHQMIDNALAMFGLQHLSDQLLHTLSGGERQKTALAGIFALEPDIMLLDEPTSALDPAARNLVIEKLENYAQNHTVLVITHDLELLGRATGAVWMLDKAGNFFSGQANETVTEKILSQVYDTTAVLETASNGRKRIFFD